MTEGKPCGKGFDARYESSRSAKNYVRTRKWKQVLNFKGGWGGGKLIFFRISDIKEVAKMEMVLVSYE